MLSPAFACLLAAALLLPGAVAAQTTPSGSTAYRFGTPKGGQDLSGFTQPARESPSQRRWRLQQKAAERASRQYTGLGKSVDNQNVTQAGVR